MLVNIYVGAITDPKKVMVDDSKKLGDILSEYNMSGEITLNGASLSNTPRNKTLKELGVDDDSYLCSARKNGGN